MRRRGGMADYRGSTHGAERPPDCARQGGIERRRGTRAVRGRGDRRRRTGEAHNVLADRPTDAMRVNGGSPPAATFIGPSRQHRQFVDELTPRKRLADLVLTDLARRACEELIEEQHRSSVLRAHSLEPRHRVLLVGPSGNGRTSLAEAIAEALAAPFFVVRYEAPDGQLPRGDRVTAQAGLRLRPDDAVRPVLRRVRRD